MSWLIAAFPDAERRQEEQFKALEEVRQLAGAG